MQENECGDSSMVTTLFGHNAWANGKLLDFCAGLSAEQLDATAPGGFGSIRDTLQHMVGSEVSYVELVNGKLPAQPVPLDQFSGFAALQDAVRWTGDELLQLALAARADTPILERDEQRLFEYPRAGLLIQAINHATEHRTQIAAILTQLGLEPPDMSGWKYMEEHGELRELDAGAEGA